MDEQRRAPSRICDGAETHTGRFSGAIAEPNITAPGGRWRLKEWNYLSLTTETHFVAFAVVQLGYAANMFCYVVDRRSRAMWQTEALAPLGRGLHIAPSSLSGTTIWQRAGQRIEIAAIARGWRATLDLQLDGKPLTGTAEIERGEGLAVVFPLAPGQLAYTHKEAGMLADIGLKFDGQPLPRDGLATLDWTRSAALRTTRWNWASTATRLNDGRRFGLNLSAHVYDDASGASVENALWLDGRLHVLGGVKFRLPASPASEVWQLTGEGIALAFTPFGARQQRVNLGIVRSEFVQPFGVFAGHVRMPDGEELRIPPAFGVVEDHLAVW
jgi:hypothetical protein